MISRYTILLFCINNMNTEWGVGCYVVEQATDMAKEQNEKVKCHYRRLAVTCTVVARCPERWHTIQNHLLGQHCTTDVWDSVKKAKPWHDDRFSLWQYCWISVFRLNSASNYDAKSAKKRLFYPPSWLLWSAVVRWHQCALPYVWLSDDNVFYCGKSWARLNVW